MQSLLGLAAAYHFVWGLCIILFPKMPFQSFGVASPTYPLFWQCIGVFTIAMAIGYAIATVDPVKHWPIVMMGLTAKLLIPGAFFQAAFADQLPWLFAIMVLVSNMVWWAPFIVILSAARQKRLLQLRDGLNTSEVVEQQTMAISLTQNGLSLSVLSARRPVLLLMLRHFGCPFCRQALADLSLNRAKLEENGFRIVLAHMTDDQTAAEYLHRYGLADLPRISDPRGRLYRALGLGKATFGQMAAPVVWWRLVKAVVIERQGMGKARGDAKQMPGLFLVDHGRVIRAHRHATISDRPDCTAMACSPGDTSEQIDIDIDSMFE